MQADKFWEMSFDEIELWFKHKEESKKERLGEIQALANLIVNGVSVILSGSEEVKVISIMDLYPELMKKEIEENKKIQEARELELYKAKLSRFVDVHNRKRGES